MSEQPFLKSLKEQIPLHQDALHAFRQKALNRLLEMGMPTRADEAFRYIPLRELYLSSFSKAESKAMSAALFTDAILPECVHSYLIFIDGKLSLEWSDVTGLPSSILISSFDEALETHSGFLQSNFVRTLKEEKDPFAYINLALHGLGAFVYLPSKVEVTVPLQCLFLSTAEKPQLTAPRIHLALGSQSSLRCIHTHLELTKKISHFALPLTEVFLDEGASFDLLSVIDPGAAWHFETLRATLKKNAVFNSLSVSFGGKAVRQSYRVQLKGENSETSLNGLWSLNGNCSAHTHALVEHEAPYTRSMQKFKGILDDHSQSSFEGKILVQPEAQKTEAYQLNNNLILGHGAIANSKPNLEIFADDVKASHGATVSQLDEDQLFYLRARGIGSDLARELLIGSFYREMIGKIPYTSVLRKLNACQMFQKQKKLQNSRDEKN